MGNDNEKKRLFLKAAEIYKIRLHSEAKILIELLINLR